MEPISMVLITNYISLNCGGKPIRFRWSRIILDGNRGLSEPYLDEIVFDLSDDTDVLEAFKDNQLDAVQLDIDDTSWQ
jgi:hypothetical protein